MGIGTQQCGSLVEILIQRLQTSFVSIDLQKGVINGPNLKVALKVGLWVRMFEKK